jgi:hypothetical protein
VQRILCLTHAHAEVLQRRAGKHEGALISFGRRAAETLDAHCDAILELDHESLRKPFADARDRLELFRVIASDSKLELIHGVAREYGQRHFWPDAADGDQRLKELPLTRIGETVDL